MIELKISKIISKIKKLIINRNISIEHMNDNNHENDDINDIYDPTKFNHSNHSNSINPIDEVLNGMDEVSHFSNFDLSDGNYNNFDKSLNEIVNTNVNNNNIISVSPINKKNDNDTSHFISPIFNENDDNIHNDWNDLRSYQSSHLDNLDKKYNDILLNTAKNYETLIDKFTCNFETKVLELESTIATLTQEKSNIYIKYNTKCEELYNYELTLKKTENNLNELQRELKTKESEYFNNTSKLKTS